MHNWILARGREAETVLADVVPAGARALDLPGADTLFAPPQKIFISEADGGETEWLGRVTAADDATLAFSRPLHASKDSGARLWRAASFIEFPPEAAHIAQISTATGITADTAPDGTSYAIRTALPLSTFQLLLDDLDAATEYALGHWLITQTRWGLDPFTLVRPPGATLMVVRLASEPIRQECDAKDRRRMILPLTILQEGVYQ